MKFYEWVMRDYPLASTEEVVVGVDQLHKLTVGAGFYTEAILGLKIYVSKRDFRRAARQLPPDTQFRFRVETYSKLNYTYRIVYFLGLAFDPKNWRGNLHLASPKQLIDLLHAHGKEVVDEASI